MQAENNNNNKNHNKIFQSHSIINVFFYQGLLMQNLV